MIIWVNSVPYKKREKDKIIYDKKECYGLADHEKKTIDIQKKQERCFKNKTIFHECLESINFQYRIGLEHEQIELLEYGIYDTIKRNKLWWLFK